jgi:NAD(P)-dependent dehydrogenase (short-subunit alcohol dehydrogenase family)
MSKRKPVADQVVVVMGALTAIGRLTAVRFAREGARVVLSARSGRGLATLVAEIRDAGGKAIAVTADTGVYAQVNEVAERAEQELGALDTWVQIGATTGHLPFDRMTPSELSHAITTGLVGQAYGAMAAIPVMKRRGGGQFISVSSVGADMSLPLHSAHAAAKHGIRGLLDSIRLEMKQQRAPITVTTVLPASIEPSSRDLARVADAIVRAAVRPRREIIVGPAGKMMVRLRRYFPRLVDAMLLRSVLPAGGYERTREEEPFNDRTQRDVVI